MTNSAILARTGAQITDVQAHLAHHDALVEQVDKSKTFIERLKSDIYAIHKNDPPIENKIRVNKLNNAVALLALEESDMSSLQADLVECKSKVAAAAVIAKESLKSISWSLLQARKSKIEAHLVELINFAVLLFRPEDVSRCARSVQEIEGARNNLITFIGQNDLDGAVGAARQLRGFADPILRWCADEPNLVLDALPAVVVQPAPAKSVARDAKRNQLGQLNQPVYA